MSESDERMQPRRYKAEVKRARVVRGGTVRRSEKPAEVVSEPKPLPAEVEEAAVEAPAAQEPVPKVEPAEAAAETESAEAAPATEEESLPEATEEDEPAPEDAEEPEEEEYKDRTKIMPDESFDYVVPRETFKEHARRKHRSTEKKHSTKSATQEEMDEAEEGFVFRASRKRRKHRHHHHHHHRRHRKGWYRLHRWQRISIVILAVLLALIMAIVGTYLVLNEIGRQGMHNYDNIDVVTPTEDESGNDIIQVDNSGRVITYDGISYELNDNLVSVAFIGTDEGTGDDEGLYMADAIYILTIDTETGKVKILGVSRDTMTDVDLYSDEGAYIDTRRLQMAYSYAYGNQIVTGGRNTAASLSRLFYGLPFDNYFAINIDALITLNDTIGGVTLTSSMTFDSPIDGRTIYEGDTVTLHGKEAEYYVRHREFDQLDSNNERMKHQQEYIHAFLSSIIPAAKKDLSLVTDLYNQIQVNSDTTLDIPKLTYLASTALKHRDSAAGIEYVSLRGEITEGEYAEMNVKNEDAIRTMLDVFYTPLAVVPDTEN